MEQEIRDCIGDLLDSTSEKAKVGEFRKTAEEKLSALNGAVNDKESAYRDALAGGNGNKSLGAQWAEQDAAICKLRKQIETCHPDWRECIDDVVCKEVIQKVADLRKKLIAKLGPPAIALDQACIDFDAADSQLEAWATIADWIQQQLTLNQGLIDEICALNNCTDRLFALYLFYFELQPSHNLLAERPDGKKPDMKDAEPERYYCASCSPPDDKDKELCGNPWLIAPEDYNCKLADVWKIWRDCGVEKAKAECAMEQVEVCRTQYEAAATDEAKRNAAKEALRRKDQMKCAPPPQQPNNPTQQMSAS